MLRTQLSEYRQAGASLILDSLPADGTGLPLLSVTACESSPKTEKARQSAVRLRDSEQEDRQQVGPIRARLIHKGLAYAPEHGLVAYTVPGVADFINGQVDRRAPAPEGRVPRWDVIYHVRPDLWPKVTAL